MLLLNCPWCGPRDEVEFVCAGPRPQRPDPSVSDEAWSAYLFVRANPRGVIREHWVHAFGCGRWLVAQRDTVTNAVSQIEPAGGGLQ